MDDPGAAAWRVLDRARTRGGDELVLRARGSTFEIRCNGWELMASRAHHSEEVAARLACVRAAMRPAPRVLIGGLGLGYTLRAALDALGARAEVFVAEVFDAVIAWNRGPLAALAHAPLADPRVRVECVDVADVIAHAPASFDAIVLDVDNGPAAIMLERNRALYGARGLAALRRALTPGGVLAVWAADRDPAFEARLRAAGFSPRMRDVPARGRAGDPSHTIYLATRGRDAGARGEIGDFTGPRSPRRRSGRCPGRASAAPPCGPRRAACRCGARRTDAARSAG